MNKFYIKYESATLRLDSNVEVLNEREILENYCRKQDINIDDIDIDKYRDEALNDYYDEEYLGTVKIDDMNEPKKYKLYMVICKINKRVPIFIDVFDNKEIAKKRMLQIYSDYNGELPFEVTGIGRFMDEDGYYSKVLPYINGKSTITKDLKNEMKDYNTICNICVILHDNIVVDELDIGI